MAVEREVCDMCDEAAVMSIRYDAGLPGQERVVEAFYCREHAAEIDPGLAS